MKKILEPKKTIMRKVPISNVITIGKTFGKDYCVMAITNEEKEWLDAEFANRAYVEKELAKGTPNVEPYDFYFKKYGRKIHNSNVVIYGLALDNSSRVVNQINDIIKSKGGVLAVPTPIDLENGMVGNRLIPGVDGIDYFKYYICMLGNPTNVLIYYEVS